MNENKWIEHRWGCIGNEWKYGDERVHNIMIIMAALASRCGIHKRSIC